MTQSKKILLPIGEQKILAAEFGVSRMTVYRALTGKRNSPTAQLLRTAAIERGGMEFDPDRRKRAK